MRHFRAAHDFKGEEAVELSVRKGELVFAAENVVQDGWIKVEATEDASRRGFVPLSYLQEITEDDAARLRGERRSTSSPGHVPASRQGHLQQTRTPSPRSDQGRHLSNAGAVPSSTSPEPKTTANWREGSKALGEAALDYGAGVVATSSQSPRDRSATTPQRSERRALQDGTDSVLANAPLTPARAYTGGAAIDRELLSNPNTVVEAFMKNEVYFKQLMRRRADALSQMQDGLTEATREVGLCKDKNAALTRKLRELDQVIEKERRRWMERVDEEKAFVTRSLSYVPGSALGLGVGNGGSPSESRQPSPMSGRRDSASAIASAGSPSVY